jgi:alkylation response protein AidB-like acyl-CoA dehydrogenase
VQLKIMDMFIKVEAARQLSRAAMAYNSQTVPPAVQYSIASKVFCTRTAFEVASDAISSTVESAWPRRCWSRSSSATPAPP